MTLSRRQFLGTSGAAVFSAGIMSKGAVSGANDKVRVCVIGINGRGGNHIDGYLNSPNAEIVALCDPDESTFAKREKQIKDGGGAKPKRYRDIRDALADDSIDAVSIATPNHWHTLAAVWALQAGKHVYVEKPATWSLWEGKQLMAATKQSGKVLQHGTQARSNQQWLRDIALLQSGEINGKVYMARGTGYKTSGSRDSLGFKPDSKPPKSLDWRLWQGPAQDAPFNELYHPYSWHWFWNYGNGEIGNQGIHQLDVAVWGMNKGFPVQVHSAGGRYTYEDQGETPNTLNSTYTFKDGTMLVFEVRNRYTNTEGGTLIPTNENDEKAMRFINKKDSPAFKFHNGVGVGNLFYTDGGYYVAGQGFYDKRNRLIDVPQSKYPYPESEGNYQNFVNSILNNDTQNIFGDAQAAHLSSGFAHLGSTSYRLGRSLAFDPKEELFAEADANAFNKRSYHKDFTVPELA